MKFLQSQSEEQVKDVYNDLVKAKKIDLENVANDPTHKTREQLLPAAAILAQYYDMLERKVPHEESKHAKGMFDYALKYAPDDLNLRSSGCSRCGPWRTARWI